MKKAEAELLSRRAELAARSAAQREELARTVASWKETLDGADRALRVVGQLKRLSPLLVGGGILASLIARKAGGAETLLHGAKTALRSARTAVNFVRSLRS